MYRLAGEPYCDGPRRGGSGAAGRRPRATGVLSLPGEHPACWRQGLSLITVRSPSGLAGMNGDDCRESRPQPIEIRLSRKKHNLDGHSLNDLGEVASSIVRRQKGELRTAGGRELLD